MIISESELVLLEMIKPVSLVFTSSFYFVDSRRCMLCSNLHNPTQIITSKMNYGIICCNECVKPDIATLIPLYWNMKEKRTSIMVSNILLPKDWTINIKLKEIPFGMFLSNLNKNNKPITFYVKENDKIEKHFLQYNMNLIDDIPYVINDTLVYYENNKIGINLQNRKILLDDIIYLKENEEILNLLRLFDYRVKTITFKKFFNESNKDFDISENAKEIFKKPLNNYFIPLLENSFPIDIIEYISNSFNNIVIDNIDITISYNCVFVKLYNIFLNF